MKTLIHAACALSLIAGSTPSLAQDEARRTTVSYHDLDLGSVNGIQALDMRVKRAVRTVCQESGRAPWERLHQQQCIRQATRDTERQVEQAIRGMRQVDKTNGVARPIAQPIETKFPAGRKPGI